ncbi:AMP-binding protein [Syntrophaceticus schinkii]|uniref:AMP-binding protein n=1 Tax=Syntrophaceticus schinkii TaxID=499207 RepID=UPI001E3A883F|nr:AMP-binding protein [Syntrophaceticus schinkii]
MPDIIDNFGKTNNIAHIYRENILTYEDLKKKSDALAFYLIKILDHDQSPIIVYGHKENEMLICFLACVKSGHPYVPLDSSILLPLTQFDAAILTANNGRIIATVCHKVENSGANQSLAR